VNFGKQNTKQPMNDRDDEVMIYRQALEDIRQMAANRKPCVRMPDGLMLDNFCRFALDRGTENRGRQLNPLPGFASAPRVG
jgi:hypothetical protein